MDERHDERQAAARSAHDDVIRALDESWASLRETLRGLVDHTPEPTADGVTAGAAAMHVARWDESTAELFRTWALDRAAPDPYSSHDKKWNALWLAQDADVDVADAVTRAEDAHLAFRAALAALDVDAWRAYGHEFATGTSEHYRSHAEHPLEFPLPEASAGGGAARS